MYNLEEIIFNQSELLKQIREYVEEQALDEDLHQVEQHLYNVLLNLGRSLLEEVVARHGTGDVGESHTHGGVTLPRHGERERSYLSIFGPIKIPRTYYWEEGEAGSCPLDEILNLPDRKMSYLLQGWIQKRAVEKSYDEAIEDIEELFHLTLPKRTQEEITRDASKEVLSFNQEKTLPPPKTEGSVIGVEADGKGIRMAPTDQPSEGGEEEPKVRRGKGEKPGLRRMSVVTALFTFEPKPRTAEEMVDILMRQQSAEDQERERAEKRHRKKKGEKEPRTALNAHLDATMAGKEIAIKELAAQIHLRDPTGEKPIVVLVDGEKALETQINDGFRKKKLRRRVDAFILDIMHAMEYIWEAGTALHGEKGEKRNPWVRQQTKMILDGRVGYVIGGLRRTCTRRQLTRSQQKVLKKTITYFENHKHMMSYDVYLEKGYPIGTGHIEGTCRSLVKDRMDISGAKWTQEGAEAILKLRAVKKNGDWKTFWDFYITKNKERLYGNSINLL